MILLPELDIDISHHVISKVVTNIEALNFPKLAKLLEDIFIEVFKVLLDPAGLNWLALGINPWGDHVRALVHI